MLVLILIVSSGRSSEISQYSVFGFCMTWSHMRLPSARVVRLSALRMILWGIEKGIFCYLSAVTLTSGKYILSLFYSWIVQVMWFFLDWILDVFGKLRAYRSVDRVDYC